MTASISGMTSPAPQEVFLADEWRFVYEWFAGWRWERYREGMLVTESLQNFETKEECIAHASRRGYCAQLNVVSPKVAATPVCADEA